MAIDGLKMIHIVGYDADEEEAFEGLGGGGADLAALLATIGAGSGADGETAVNLTPMVTVVPPGSSLPIAPIQQEDIRNWLEKTLEESAPLLDTLLSYLDTQAVGLVDPNTETDPAERSLRKSRAFGIAPVLASIGGIAKGLPALLKGGTALGLLNTVGTEIVKDVEDAIDPLDPGWRLYFIERVLKQALLTPDNESALTQLQSILDQRLADLAYVDETVDFGFCRVHIKGKMIEY